MANLGRSNELSSFMQSLDTELMCGICLEFFESPIMLPCGHNFCRKCIHSVIENGRSFSFLSLGPPTSFNCPVCKTDIAMSNYGVDNLPVNKPLESIIAMYQSYSPVDIFDMAWHRDLDIDIRTCPEHKHPMTKFCESCCISVCRTCEKVEHKTRHRVTSLLDVASTLQADIADTLTELKRKTIPVYERIELLHSTLKALDTEEEHMKRCLTHNMEALKSSLRAKQEELSGTVDSKVYEAAVPINEQLTQCKMYRTQIQEMMKKLSAIRKTKDVNQRIKLMKDTILNLNLMLQDDFEWTTEITIPLCDLPELKLNTEDVTASIASLQWTETDQRKKKFCTKCTQTDSDVSIQVQTNSNNEALDIQAPVNASKHDPGIADLKRGTDEKDGSQLMTDKSSLKDSNTDNGAEIIVNLATSADINKDYSNKVKTHITMSTDAVARSEKTRSEEAMSAETRSAKMRSELRSKKGNISSSGLKQEPEIPVNNNENDSRTKDMSSSTAVSKPVKSSSRRSFPIDRKSDTCEDTPSSAGQTRNVKRGDLVNGVVRTSPKNVTSEALATFVARRRTLSPFPSDKSRPRVSTSPLTKGNDEVVMETRNGTLVTKETNMATDNTPERALSPRNYSKEPISVQLDFSTDV